MLFIRFFISVLILAVTCSCSLFSAKPDKKPPAPISGNSGGKVGTTTETVADAGKPDKFIKDGIVIQIAADAELNRFQAKPYALNLCVYQLMNPNGFNQLVEERDGLSKLMQCNRFDNSVVNAKRLVVQPGSDIRDVRDRAEGSRYVGVVAGYYNTEKHRATGLLELPRGGVVLMKLELGPAEISSMGLQR